jgi:hypothetical protein
MQTVKFNYFRNIISILICVAALPAFSQQSAILMPLESDSTQVELNRQIEYQKLISGSLFDEQPEIRNGFPNTKFNFGDFQNNNLRLNFNDLKGFPITGFSAGNMGTYFSPFLHDATILSQGAYSLGNKFVLGGFSYGANSVFSAPFPNQTSPNFDEYGSTIFMQYKVAKGFRIETRFNVTNRPGPGF